jgi:hypothetical protein
VTVVVALPVLLPGFGSTVGLVTLTVAEFVMLPADAGAFIVRTRGGADDTGSTATPLYVHVMTEPAVEQVQPVPAPAGDVTPVGKLSVTVNVVTESGPALLTVTVYESGALGTADAVPVFVRLRSAAGVTLVVMVADVLFAGLLST